MSLLDAEAIIQFWFEEISTESWFKKDPTFDRLIQDRFQPFHEAAIKCECSNWRKTDDGRLAEIIILDQFSRNIYRDDPRSFAYDPLALALAQEAVALGTGSRIQDNRRLFLYLPFMHSESRVIHEQAVELFSQSGLEAALDFEFKHKRIIDRFGRYPHRNEILGRVSTPEEIEFLEGPDSSF